VRPPLRLAVPVLFAAAAFGTALPSLSVAPEIFHWGEARRGEPGEAEFVLRNEGAGILTVEGIRGRIEIVAAPEEVRPGESGRLIVRVPTAERLGLVTSRIFLDTNDPDTPSVRVAAVGFVGTEYIPERGLLDLGIVDRRRPRRHSFMLSSVDTPDLAIVEVLGAPTWLRLEISPATGGVYGAAELAATVEARAPLGAASGVLTLRTSSAAEPTYELPWRASVFEGVEPSRDPLDLGVLRVGDRGRGVVELHATGSASLEISSLRVETDGGGTLEVFEGTCAVPSPSCAAIEVALSAAAEGRFTGRVLASVAELAEPVALRVGATVVARDVPVHDLGEIGRSAEPDVPPRREPAGLDGVEPRLSAAPDRAVVRWRTQDERGAYGYAVLRAETPVGPFRRISTPIVRVPDDGAAVHEYSFEDREVTAGRVYYYCVDIVAATGLKHPFTGIQAVEIRAPGSG
jgi:hypothetical protein